LAQVGWGVTLDLAVNFIAIPHLRADVVHQVQEVLVVEAATIISQVVDLVFRDKGTTVGQPLITPKVLIHLAEGVAQVQ
jgi:hypothetical protein